MKNILLLLLIGLTVFSCSKEKPSEVKKLSENVKVENNVRLNSHTILDILNSKGIKSKLTESEGKGYRGGACEAAAPTSLGCFSYDSQMTIEVPANGNTPGCDNVFVTFSVVVCLDANWNLVSLSFSGFNATPVGCDDLWNYWQFSGLSHFEIGVSFDAFNYRASLITEAIVLNSFIGNTEFPCPNSFVKTEFTKQDCYSVCKTETEVYPFANYEYHFCGDICCVRTSNWCRDSSGELQRTGMSFEIDGDYGDCEDNEQGIDCDGELLGTCDMKCGPIVE